MLYSSYYRKDTHEDPKTSSIFETLMMLPDDMFWSILRSACYDNSNLPKVSGMIESFEFWPKWDPTGTNNNTYVEPDLFIQFQQFDLIIEAKYNDFGGQHQQQWTNEIKAYCNEYEQDKPVYFIAVGGNAVKNNDRIDAKNTTINKCTWLSVLMQITRLKSDLESVRLQNCNHSVILRILNLITLAFNIHGVYDIHWFNEIATPRTIISTDSITTLKSFFR
jgi:hypothetical protein